MADDKVAIWGQGLKFGRKPGNGELLIGNGQDLTMATLTAGAGASITNTPGGIEISATGSGVSTVTASSPLASSGGSTPDISLTGVVGVTNGGTGASTLTANNVLIGNGTSPVGFVAPGASGNVLTSNGTGWASSAPQWTRIVKASDQSFASTTYADDAELKFSVSANKAYILRARCFVLTANSGGMKVTMSGPSSPVYARISLDGYAIFVSTLGSDILFNNANLGAGLITPLIANISNGTNAGTVALRWAQAQGPSGTLTVYAGSWLEWAEVI
jgi:hypothetical protein